MNAVDRLRRDHGILRAKLNVLEAALRVGEEAWFVLREVCVTLSRQLRDHIRREEELVAACRAAMIPPPATSAEGGSAPSAQALRAAAGGGMNPKVLAEIVVEHRDEPAHLRALNRLFVSAPTHAVERLRPALEELIRRLRRHMAEEERELFPIVERVLGEAARAGPRVAPSAHFDEAMTVNRVVQEFPGTRPVFERLFISVPLEGCTCLDEVAWRHGMEVEELLEALETVQRSCACTRGEQHAPGDPVAYK